MDRYERQGDRDKDHHHEHHHREQIPSRTHYDAITHQVQHKNAHETTLACLLFHDGLKNSLHFVPSRESVRMNNVISLLNKCNVDFS